MQLSEQLVLQQQLLFIVIPQSQTSNTCWCDPT